MRRLGPVISAAVVLIVNAIVLAGVAWNRSGGHDAEITLTERELSPPYVWNEENTGIALRLVWEGESDRWDDDGRLKEEPRWFDQGKLAALGFDCSYPIEAVSADEHYSRMLPREAFVVLEYDGDAWRRWLAEREKRLEEELRKAAVSDKPTENAEAARKSLESDRTWHTHLFAVDAGGDAESLRARYPDRANYIVARASVALRHVRPHDPDAAVQRKPFLRGVVQSILGDSIHVPRDGRAMLDDLRRQDLAAQARGDSAARYRREPARAGQPRYEVRLRYGRRLEPWVVEVRQLSRPPG